MTTPDVDFHSKLRDMRWGLLLSLLTILFGFVLGGLFGGLEDVLKGRLQANADAAEASVYTGDDAKKKAVLDKSWNYLQRAHLHGGAIGSVSVGATLLLAALRRPRSRTRGLVALALGLGAFGYSEYWMFAGFSAPGLGGTAAAKDAFEWLAVPSAGLLLVGLSAVIGLTARDLFADSAREA